MLYCIQVRKQEQTMKTQWEVKFAEKFLPTIVSADSFLEAVEEARKISEEIVSITYLCY